MSTKPTASDSASSGPVLDFYHAPQTRSTGVLILLEALGVDYQLHLLNLKHNEHRQAPYLAINPMGKVPAIRHGEAVVTEQVAVYMYLADRFPAAGLAPALDDPLRGPYLRWMVYYAACFEPAVMDRSLQREPGPVGSSPYGDFDSVFNTVNQHLSEHPYILGETFSAADLLWGIALGWVTMFKLLPESAAIQHYVERIAARPEVIRAREKDSAWAAQQQE